MLDSCFSRIPWETEGEEEKRREEKSQSTINDPFSPTTRSYTLLKIVLTTTPSWGGEGV